MVRLNYLWRLLMTGVAFASFSLGGLLITLLAFPVIRILPGGPDKCRARSQHFIHHMFRLFVGFMCVSGIMRLRVQGAEVLRNARGVLVLANHPTLIDVVVMISLMPRADCVVKAALWDSPFLGGVVRAAGYINNDKTPEELVSACAQAITTGGALIIFPEGTRSVPGQALRFQRGAAHIALESRAPILPVVLTCTPPTLMKGQPWYRIPPRRFEVGLEVKSALAVGDMVDLNLPPTLGTRRLTEALEDYFTRELASHAGHAGSDQAPDHRGA